MTKKWIAINLLLLLIAVITGRQLYVSVQDFKTENDLSKIQPDRSLSQKIAQETILPPPLTDIRYSVADFAVIPEKNLFSESRSMEGSMDSPTPSGTMPASQKPILVGIILTEDQKMAYILEPRGRNRDSKVQSIQIGDDYAGYTVTEIASDHIVLDNDRQKEVITLDNSTQTARRGGTNAAPVKMFSIGSSAATGNIQFSINAGGTGASKTPPTSTARTVTPRTNTNIRNNVVAVSGIQAGGQQTEPTSQGNNQQQDNTQSPKSQPPVPTSGGVQRDPRVIRSPFGDIIRPDP